MPLIQKPGGGGYYLEVVEAITSIERTGDTA